MKTRRLWIYRISQSLMFWGFRIVFGLRMEGVDHVPASGRILLAPNHRSYLDPPLAGVGIARELYFLAKIELFKNPILGAIFRAWNGFPVRRAGVDKEAIQTIGSLLEQEQAVVIFPEGGRCRIGGFLPAQKGIAMVALRYQADIIPVYIRGSFPWQKSLIHRGLLKVTYGNLIRWEDASEHGEHRDQLNWIIGNIEAQWRQMAASDPK
jgi:1-acyl-sn-glycerol-3-phosphate acyltransferase